MAPTEPYRGAISLASSKYASPSATRKAFTTMPSAVSPVTKAPVNTAGASNAIATKEQVAAAAKDVTTHTPYNADAQLAMAQDEALKDEVEKHSAKFAKSVSSAVSNTRRLLTLIRDSVKEGGDEASASLKSVDTLWQELEQLFEAAQNAKSALPDFLEKQKGNMSLYHNSVINETIRETQDELNLQHKKVNIQHSLILERQQAFLDHKAQTDAKLKEFTELQERVSRLTLDKGLLRTELDNVQQHLDEERKGKAEGLQKAGSLKKEVEALEATKEKLATEGDTLRATISDLQDKVKAAEHKATDHYEKEIRRVGEQLAKEQHKATALDTLVKALQKGDNSAKKEVEKLRTEQKLLQDKYNHQSAEYSKAFTVSDHTLIKTRC
ncbi:hypothetical protein BU26DRAFT_276030 [Trematosphaeria pertusa]|uniref:Uncharacterized protein n=1 Tax=Trematosphaeria pertusa TaxID=390896 RepID=A0A6A6ILI8_9PLEO|nr:uncharacterized protein BU26DRAFT_276030 [Trematosphaeria pertusa]KAF2251079.1 hypothetical protein BU26DRAFT_276030 [Trematosphaeria pertusa]